MLRITIHPLVVFVPHVLCALAIASNLPTYRKTTFIAIFGVAHYVIHYTTLGEPIEDYRNACMIVGVVFSASDTLLINNPLTRLRTTGQKAGAESLPFFSRFRWTIHLLVSPRLVGWTGEPSEVLPPHPKQKTKIGFAAHLISSLAINIVLLDIVGTMMMRTTIFSSNSGGLHLLSWLPRSMYVALFGYAQYINLSLAHLLWMLLLTATGRWEPSEFRPLFGSWWQAYTVRKFWGRTWHQLLRRIFKVHGEYVTRTLLCLPKGQVSSYIQLYIAFIISGIIHHWAEFMPMSNWRGASMRFFLLQAVAIHCEDIVIAIATRLGIKENQFWRTVGYIWMWQWFTLSVPLWVEAPIKGGLMDNPPQVGIIRAVCSPFGGRYPCSLSA